MNFTDPTGLARFEVVTGEYAGRILDFDPPAGGTNSVFGGATGPVSRAAPNRLLRSSGGGPYLHALIGGQDNLDASGRQQFNVGGEFAIVLRHNANVEQADMPASEIAAVSIFQNLRVPEEVVNLIPREELVEFAELRVKLAELTNQPGADEHRLGLQLARAELAVGAVGMVASVSSSVVGVLNPARTIRQVRRDLPLVLLGPEGQAARQGATFFGRGLAEIKAIVRNPIGTPIPGR